MNSLPLIRVRFRPAGVGRSALRVEKRSMLSLLQDWLSDETPGTSAAMYPESATFPPLPLSQSQLPTQQLRGIWCERVVV